MIFSLAFGCLILINIVLAVYHALSSSLHIALINSTKHVPLFVSSFIRVSLSH